MRIVNQEVVNLTTMGYEDAVRLAESAGRTCYKSVQKDFDSSEKFIRNLIKRGHESVIEHFNITLRLITDRGITHQLVRHRLASYSQESTRYCNYSSDKFDNQISVINPGLDIESDEFKVWSSACLAAEKAYIELKDMGISTDKARAVLPTCLKTEIVMTANARQFRHIIKIRTENAAHFQIRELFGLVKDELIKSYPCFFEDLK